MQAAALGDRRPFAVVLRDGPYSPAAYATITRLRAGLAVAAPGSLVGGSSAVQLDVKNASARDDAVLAPLVQPRADDVTVPLA
jgi:putative drug exporter of the RND superfamily